jgi:hypothetical protein
LGLDLESEQRVRLLPDFEMEQYDISPDCKRVAFISLNQTARPGVWVATMDGSTPPRQLTSSRGQQAFFGAAGDVFFAAQEKDGTFIYRANERGGDLQKAIPHSIFSLYGVSPDGKFLALWGGPTEAQHAVTAILTILRYCAGRQTENWSSWAALAGQAISSVPLRAGQVLPPLPREGLRSVEAMAALPGAKRVPKPFAVAGSEPAIYVYPKFTAQRNIYRVPVPWRLREAFQAPAIFVSSSHQMMTLYNSRTMKPINRLAVP